MLCRLVGNVHLQCSTGMIDVQHLAPCHKFAAVFVLPRHQNLAANLEIGCVEDGRFVNVVGSVALRSTMRSFHAGPLYQRQKRRHYDCSCTYSTVRTVSCTHRGLAAVILGILHTVATAYVLYRQVQVQVQDLYMYMYMYCHVDVYYSPSRVVCVSVGPRGRSQLYCTDSTCTHTQSINKHKSRAHSTAHSTSSLDSIT